MTRSPSLRSTGQLSYLGRDASKPALQEDQVLFLALALRLCESLSVVLLLSPLKKKKGNLHSSLDIQTKSPKYLGYGSQTGLFWTASAANTCINTGKRSTNECGLCKTVAGQRIRQGSFSLCQKYQCRYSCKVKFSVFTNSDLSCLRYMFKALKILCAVMNIRSVEHEQFSPVVEHLLTTEHLPTGVLRDVSRVIK